MVACAEKTPERRLSRAVLEDKVWRAYGILRTARSIGLEEMMNLLSGVRLGVSLKLLKSPRVETLNEILAEHTGKPLDVIAKDTDRDHYMTAEEAKRRTAAAASPSPSAPCRGQPAAGHRGSGDDNS